MKSVLPSKLPEEWLIQIRDASKSDTKTLWITLLGTGLGSAVIAALISLAVAHFNAQQASNLETEKARIEIKKERLQGRQKPFEKLAESLRRLHNELGDAAATLAVATPEKTEIGGYAQQSLAKVETVMEEIFEENRDDRIDQDIRKRVREMANSLDPALKAAKSNPKGYPAFTELYKTHLNQELNEINRMIEEAMNRMTVWELRAKKPPFT